MSSVGGAGRPGRRLQQAHNPQEHFVVTPPKTSVGCGKHTFKRDLQLGHITGRVKRLFYERCDERRYQRFYV